MGKRQSRIQQTFVDISIKRLILKKLTWSVEEYGQEKCSNYIYKHQITLNVKFICYKSYSLRYLTKVQLIEENEKYLECCRV